MSWVPSMVVVWYECMCCCMFVSFHDADRWLSWTIYACTVSKLATTTMTMSKGLVVVEIWLESILCSAMSWTPRMVAVWYECVCCCMFLCLHDAGRWLSWMIHACTVCKLATTTMTMSKCLVVVEIWLESILCSAMSWAPSMVVVWYECVCFCMFLCVCMMLIGDHHEQYMHVQCLSLPQLQWPCPIAL